MPNQPAKDSTIIPIRIAQKTKNAIQAEVERLNTQTPGANWTVSSWIRTAIDFQLKAAEKK